MNKLFQRALLGVGMAVLSSASASANQLSFVVTAAQILGGSSSSASYSTNCGGNGATGLSATFPLCGIFGIGLSTANISIAGATSVTASIIGITSSNNWVAVTIPGTTTVGIENQDLSGGTIAYIAPQSSAANTIGAGLVANGTTATYTTDVAPATNLLKPAAVGTAGDGVGSFVGILSASTQFQFLVNFSGTIASGTTANLTLDTISARINATTGAQQSKTLNNQFTVSGIAGTSVATPEPSSALLLLGGSLAAFGARRYRNSKRV